MSSQKTPVSVQIMDQTFHIATDASPEHAEKVAEYLNACIKEIQVKSKSISPYHATVLAALNIAEKYLNLMEKEAEFKTRVAEKSRRILGLLNSGIQAPNS